MTRCLSLVEYMALIIPALVLCRRCGTDALWEDTQDGCCGACRVED